MGQVAHGGETGVVRGGRHLAHAALQGLPQLARLGDRLRVGSRAGGEHHQAVLVEIGLRMGYSGLRLARNWMGRDEPR